MFINLPRPNPQQQQQTTAQKKDKRMKQLLLQTLSSLQPGMSQYTPLIAPLLPDAKTIYDVANQLLEQRGPIWDEMQKHLKDIKTTYEAD